MIPTEIPPPPDGLVEGTRHDGPIEDRCTVVVIGSGAGGGVVAHELVKAGIDTIVVEEGGWYPPEFYRELTPLESFKYLYRDYGMTTAVGKNLLKDPAVPFPLGKCIGGTTTINSGTCFRTPEMILDQWNQEFGLDVDKDELETIFDEVERDVGIAPARREVLGDNMELFAEGAEKLGWNGGPLTRNAPECAGSGRCVFGCPTDAKRGTHLSYIPMSLEKGARVYSDFRVERLIRRNGRFEGVEGVLLDRERNAPHARALIRADAVVVAAGAVGTPVLLQQNEVAVANPHLGENLRLHPGIRVAAIMDQVIRGWKGIPQGYYVDEFWEEHGIMFEGIFVPPGVGLPVLPGSGDEFRDIARLYPNLAAFGAMVKDTSKGQVKHRPGLGTVIRYQLNRLDKERLVDAVKKAAEAYFAVGAERVFPAIFGHMELNSPDDLARIDPRRVRSQHLELMAFHPMGTARMAADPGQGVLDPQGRVHGTENLYVADASVFPTCLGVNPMESIWGFGAVIARRLADRLSGG